MAAPTINPLPPAPLATDSGDVFDSKAFTFVGALDPFRAQLQAVADYVSTAVDNAAAIEAVSDNISDVNTVADDIANVNAVAGNEANVNTVAADIANVNTVAGISTEVAALEPVAADIPTVAANAADIPAAAAIGRRQALYARSVAENPPVGPETLRLDYANRAYGLGDKSTGLIDDIVAFETAHTFTRGSAKWAPDTTGTLIEYGVDKPAYTYDETGKALGLLIEEQRTNLLLWSEDLSNPYWSKLNVIVDAESELLPNGLLGGHSITATQGPNNRISATITGAGVWTASITYYLKMGNRGSQKTSIFNSDFSQRLLDLDVDFLSGSVAADAGEFEAKYCGDWLKVTGSVVVSDSINMLFRPSNSVSDEGAKVLFWSAQVEQGSSATSYIPTAGTQVTRAADNCSRTLGAEYHGEAGSLSVTAAVPTGETVISLGSQSIVSDSDAEKTYTLSYTADPSATTLDVAPGVSVAAIKRIEYNPVS